MLPSRHLFPRFAAALQRNDFPIAFLTLRSPLRRGAFSCGLGFRGGRHLHAFHEPENLLLILLLHLGANLRDSLSSLGLVHCPSSLFVLYFFQIVERL
nr:MAG TPA: hypothetical protein [Caudoviricetes sp.]